VVTHLEVGRDRRSYTVKFGFWSQDPEKAAAMARELLRTYVGDQVERKRRDMQRIAIWMSDRVDLLRAKYQQSQDAVQQYMMESGLIDAGAQTSLENQLITLSTDAARARANVIETSVKARRLDHMQKDGTLLSAPEVLASPAIQQLTLSSVQAKPTVWTTALRALVAEIDTQAARIVQSAQVEAENAIERENQLQGELKTVRAELVRRRLAEPRLEELRREVASDRSVLDDALAQWKSQAMRSEAVRPDVEVLTIPDTPLQPASPNATLAALATLLIALLAGAAMIRREITAWARTVYDARRV
jgi:uncharacterized protein involved in exopolysaccharide biosynthesis